MEMESFNRRLHKMLSEQMEKLDSEKKAVICSLAEMINIRMGVPADHLKKIKYNSRILAQSLQLSPDFDELVTEEFLDNIGDAAMLHNLGYLWNTDKEGHCERGVEILEELLEYEPTSFFKEMAIEIIRCHHDRYNECDWIPLSARITRIINKLDHNVDIVRSESDDENEIKLKAIEMMMPDSGKIYDPILLEILRKVQRQLRINQ